MRAHPGGSQGLGDGDGTRTCAPSKQGSQPCGSEWRQTHLPKQRMRFCTLLLHVHLHTVATCMWALGGMALRPPCPFCGLRTLVPQNSQEDSFTPRRHEKGWALSVCPDVATSPAVSSLLAPGERAAPPRPLPKVSTCSGLPKHLSQTSRELSEDSQAGPQAWPRLHLHRERTCWPTSESSPPRSQVNPRDDKHPESPSKFTEAWSSSCPSGNPNRSQALREAIGNPQSQGSPPRVV